MTKQYVISAASLKQFVDANFIDDDIEDAYQTFLMLAAEITDQHPVSTQAFGGPDAQRVPPAKRDITDRLKKALDILGPIEFETLTDVGGNYFTFCVAYNELVEQYDTIREAP